MSAPSIRRLGNLGLLLVGVLAGSAAVRWSAPEPVLDHVTPKLSFLSINSERYDVLFVGSSRVYRQISPKVFDRRLKKHGLRLRSFNAGIPAAKSVEVWHLLRRLEEEGSLGPRYVLIEPDGLQVSINRENTGTQREIYWHGWEETALSIRSLEGLDVVPRTRMSLLHLSAMSFRSMAVGRLRSVFETAFDSSMSRRPAARAVGPDGDGWVPFVEADGPQARKRRREFLDGLPRYRRMLARQPRLMAETACMTEYHEEMLGKLANAVESLGAEPVFMLSPATLPRCEVHQAFRDGVLPNLLAFDDAKRHPRLYQVESRFDFEHVNRRGAEIYSRLLADAFAAQLSGTGEEADR